MSASNIEVVQRVYDSMRTVDVEAVVRECDPAVEYESLIAAIDGRIYHGHDGMRRFFSDMREAWDVWSPSVERFEAEGDYVLVIGTSQIRGRGSGLDMDFKWGQVLHLRDGKVLHGKLYSDQEEAETAFRALSAG